MEHFVIMREERYRVVREDQSYCRGPYLYTTLVQQEPPMTHKVQTYATPLHEAGDYQQPFAHKGPNYPRVPSKKHGGVMDCNEVAKLYGGVVFTEYGRNKFPRA
ncbi:hypothetical protein L484_005253 [Morus notabilis]|uniref:Uncharacterized protein n=1 Tax=Morus notabilis TaxID=981085 RepID=W9S2W8_9ROSA|nr:hypothetical protein L484_005253 [Morus notabilis]